MDKSPAGLRLDHRLLAELARAVEDGDPIAWGDTALDRDAAYDLLASQVAEMFHGYEAKGLSRDRQLVVALATLVKLTVENFVLHQRLLREATRAGPA
jgi:hypothetical protein